MAEEQLSYKKASARLEEIVRKIEQESPDVDELTKLVAEAVELTKFCSEKLNKADKQLSELIAQLDEAPRAKLIQTSLMKRIAIIVAGGKGLRLGADLPKQFLPLKGLPILMHTLRAFSEVDERILVLPKEHISYWQELCREYDFKLSHRVVFGGETRFHSVRNAVLSLKEEGECLVAIHDGVRPLLSAELQQRLFALAEQEGAVIPTIPLTDSLREIKTDGTSLSVDRASYRAVQTPQVFKGSILDKMYAEPYQSFFTDDASVYEYVYQSSIQLTEGEERNIKITYNKDLFLAEYLLG